MTNILSKREVIHLAKPWNSHDDKNAIFASIVPSDQSLIISDYLTSEKHNTKTRLLIVQF